MTKIINPILSGFNPDPSIIRVEENYYIATSTFEWFPGVQIYHSKDLVNWELIARPLNRVSQLDMKGNPDSGGIWAPCLSYDNGIFYLVYTDVKGFDNVWWDTNNYLVSTKDIRGDWSEPIYLNSCGFDPSLFHDSDGKKYFVNMITDHRGKNNRFNEIQVQEYSASEKSLLGEAKTIFKGTGLGSAEGAHLYKLNGYYYLITAEGGTGYNHVVTFARSKNIAGPYEVHPDNPILSSKYSPDLPLQKAGHGDIIETQTGEWYMVHLCGRPLEKRGNCPLGRETAIQRLVWRSNWPYLAEGGNEPQLEVESAKFSEANQENRVKKIRDDFDTDQLDINFQTLRVPLNEDRLSLSERPGYLRLKGAESLNSKHCQALVARRLQSCKATVTTAIEFQPDNFKEMAGLVSYYNTENFYYLYISDHEVLGKALYLITCNNGKAEEPLADPLPLYENKRVYLRIEIDYHKTQFYYSLDEDLWKKVGPVLETGKLSDDYINGWAFTGTFIGICCQDLASRKKYADFDYFEYQEK